MKKLNALIVGLCVLATPFAATPAFATHSGIATENVTITGKVVAYQPGMFLTVVRADGAQLSFLINSNSQVPSDLAVGQRVTVNALENELRSVTRN